LERSIHTARNREGKAEAAYAFASYYYKHGLLLLYNDALWDYQRIWSLSSWWNVKHATKEDIAAVRRHLYDHDVYAYSMKLCLDVARRYPGTKAAPKALYRAACSAHHLASLNHRWEDEAKRIGLIDKSVNYLRSLAKAYPRDKLAHSARKYAAVFERGE
jgi:hypothetical protein